MFSQAKRSRNGANTYSQPAAKRRSVQARTSDATSSDDLAGNEATTERSVRDRGVTSHTHARDELRQAFEELTAQDESAALGLSATNTDDQANGVMRSAVSSIHLEDAPVHPPAVITAAARSMMRDGALPFSGCPVCQEAIFTIYEDRRNTQGPGGLKLTARSSNARSAMQQKTTNRYAMVFRAETILRGVLCDDEIFKLILNMHRLLIEKPLSLRPEIKFVPWTMGILRTHFDADAGHTFDKIRLLDKELRRTDRLLETTESYIEFQDAEGNTRLDTRAVMAIERLSSHKVKMITLKDQFNREKPEDLAGAIFSINSGVSRLAHDGAREVTSDPRVAAGTMAVGGDALRSANVKTSNVTGTAEEYYGVGGF